MLNAIGLQNIGARAFIEEKLPKLRKIKDAVVIANVYGYSTEEYVETIRILNEGEGIAAYELNVSCPNVRYGGITFGQDPYLLSEVVSSARAASTRPLIVKLSPNVTNIGRMARAAEDAGANAVSLVNTFLAMAIDPVTRRPRISNVTAGLSGPAIKPIAVRMVYEVSQSVKIPIIGIGGITTPEDVVEFLLAGATAVEVGTANFWDPRACERLVNQLERWCLEQHIESVAGLRGGLILG
jgi:dihydroorotate dehydrogenase (NAD+) catalytic subunit